MLKKQIFRILKTKNCINQLYSLLFTTAIRTNADTKAISVKDTLLNPVTDVVPCGNNGGKKVTIVGIGNVGMATAINILTQHISGEICLIDANEDKLCGELLDTQHASCFLQNPKITASTDYAVSANSRLCVITAGALQKMGESRLALVQRNADIVKTIAPRLAAYSPDTIIILASNPVDIMTYVAWKTSCLPKNRVIGSGTTLDSARFRFLIAQRLGIAPTSCNGYIIGEHGDSSVPVWSSVNVAGVRLRDLNPDIGSPTDPENWNEVHKQVVEVGYQIRYKKGYTSWGISASIASLASAILRNANTITPVSTSVKGEHGITDDIFLSLPCALNANGISNIVRQTLTKTEIEQLHKSAKIIADAQAGLKL